MARGRKGTGVECRENDYRIRFTWNGQRYAEPVDLRPSVAHTKHVTRLAADLQRAIAEGTFSFARFFPDSPRAKASGSVAATFGGMSALWLATRGSALAKWTRKKDADYVRFWVGKFGADTAMADLLPSKVEAVVGSHPWPSNKHRNNLLAALRGIFDLWVADDERNRVSPAARITNGKVQKARPDPFDMAEVEIILADMSKHYDAQVVAYYEFAFFSGVRPEEQIALRWPKIDGRQKTALIDVARTARAEKPTKNYELRTIELNQRAWAALERMRPWTALKPHDHVFENPRTGKPWASEADQRDLYWTPTLKRLRLRHRRAYQTRATCATMYLMMGRDPGWIAGELGHSERVFWESYAATIKRVRRGNQHKTFEQDLARLTDQAKTA